MLSLLQRFVRTFGWIGFLRVAVHPVTLLVTTPIRLGQTLWSCRVLADGQ